MSRVFISVLAGLAILSWGLQPTMAAKNGFSSDTTKTQGNGGKTNDNANPDNNGQVTTTTSGPKGALKNDNTPDSNVTTTTSGPGNSNK